MKLKRWGLFVFLAFGNSSFGSDITGANVILRATYNSSLTNDTQYPITYTDNNELIYKQTSFVNNTQQIFKKKGNSAAVAITPVMLLLQPNYRDLFPFYEYYSVAVSPNGQFVYYVKVKSECAMSSGGNNSCYSRVSSGYLNNGPTLESVLYDPTGTDYSGIGEVAVNNNGVAVINLLRSGSNGYLLPREYAIVYPSGVKRTLSYATYPDWCGAVAINDLETAYFVEWDYSITSIDKFGTRRNTGPNQRNCMAPYMLRAINLTSYDHPEGIVYYTDTMASVKSNEDGVIVNLNGVGNIDSFFVNDKKQILVNWEGRAYENGQYVDKFFVQKGPNVETDLVIKTGEMVNEEVGSWVKAMGLNNNGEFAVLNFRDLSGYDNGNYVQKLSYLVVESSLNPRACNVADIQNKSVQFWAQTDSRWGSDTLGFGAASDQSGDVDLRHFGCVTTATTMLMNFYGIDSYTDGNPATTKQLTPKVSNQIFTGITDLKNKEVIVYSEDFGNHSAHNNVIYPLAAEAARVIDSKNCFQMSGTKTLAEKNRCIAESASKISFKPALTTRWQSITSDLNETKKMAGMKAIESEICNGNPVLIRVARKEDPDDENNTTLVGHTMLAIGSFYDNGNLTFKVHNPATTSGAGKNLSDVIRYPYFIGYDIFKQAADPAMISIISSQNVNFVVTDPLGRKTGYDSNNNIFYNQIPGATYLSEKDAAVANDDEDGVVSKALQAKASAVNKITFETSQTSGSYGIATFGNSTGNASVQVSKTDANGFSNDNEKYYFAVANRSVASVTFKHTDVAAPDLSAQLFLNNVIYNQPRNVYGKKPAYPPGSVYLTGQLILPDGKRILNSGSLNLTIGGGADYKKSFSMASFIQGTSGNLVTYSYTQGSTNITIREDGQFTLQVTDVPLSQINFVKWGVVNLGYNQDTGAVNLSLSCNGDICTRND